MNHCPFCDDPPCPACGRCLRAGHHPDCPSLDAQAKRARIARLDRPKTRAVGEPPTLLDLLLQDED